MPSLNYHIESSGVNILDTVTQQVVGGLLQELDLTKTFENAVYILQSFSAYSQYDDGSGAVSLVKDRCDVNVNYTLDPAQVPWPDMSPYNTPAAGLRTTTKGAHTPILVDPEAGILIEHYTTACGIELDFTLTFQTFEDAVKTFDTIQTKYKGTLIQKPFDLSFAYPVSMGMFKYLTSVYKAKTAYQTKTFLEYINDTKVTEISLDVRKSQLIEEDADMELMVRCQQLGSVGQLTMDQKEPEAIRENQLPDSFVISFTFQFQFGRPNLVRVHTPVSVDNTLLDPSLFTSVNREDHYASAVTGVGQELLVSEYLRRGYVGIMNSSGLIRMPAYDDWFFVDKTYLSFEYRPFVIAHFTLDGPVTTIDLKNLGEVQLHPIVKSILQDTGSSSLFYGGLFNIGVYAGTLRLDPEILSLDDDLILTITSSRPDKVYHLVISETTSLKKTDESWDPILIKYRYFFPMTIERNINHLIKKQYFYIAYNDAMLTLINQLINQGRLKGLLSQMVADGEDSNQLFNYTQNATQLADYMAYTQSIRDDFTLPSDTSVDPIDILVREFYSSYASPESRSLLVVFLEDCVRLGYVEIADLPEQYLQPNRDYYPYTQYSGGTYGLNTPLRVLNFDIRTERRSH